MTNDTMKSLGYLKKSLKISTRAVEKNDDQVSGTAKVDLLAAIVSLLGQIDAWEKIAASPAAPVQTAAPVAVPDDSGDSDLLTT